MIFKLEVPVPDYCGESVYEQPFYFEGEVCPTYDQLVAYFEAQHEEWKNEPSYDGSCEAVLRALKGVDRFETILSTYAMITAGRTSVKLAKDVVDDVALTWHIVRPIKLGETNE